MITARLKADRFRRALIRLIESAPPQLSMTQALEIIEEECDVMRGKLIRAKYDEYQMVEDSEQ